MEDLRQKCLHDKLEARGTEDKWWEYIARVHSTCYSVINEECSERAHQHLGLSWEETTKCVADSFTEKSNWEDAKVHNTIIDKEIEYWKDFGTNIYPSVVINKKTYRGQIDPLSVYNAICAGFQDPPQACYKTLHRAPNSSINEAMSTTISDGVTVAEVLGLVFALVLLNVLVVYCCRRRARREMQSEMQMQIESQVSQYFALTQKAKNGRTQI